MCGLLELRLLLLEAGLERLLAVEGEGCLAVLRVEGPGGLLLRLLELWRRRETVLVLLKLRLLRELVLEGVLVEEGLGQLFTNLLVVQAGGKLLCNLLNLFL